MEFFEIRDPENNVIAKLRLTDIEFIDRDGGRPGWLNIHYRPNNILHVSENCRWPVGVKLFWVSSTRAVLAANIEDRGDGYVVVHGSRYPIEKRTSVTPRKSTRAPDAESRRDEAPQQPRGAPQPT